MRLWLLLAHVELAIGYVTTQISIASTDCIDAAVVYSPREHTNAWCRSIARGDYVTSIPSRELSGYVRNSTRLCAKLGDLSSVATKVDIKCTAKTVNWETRVKIVTKPILGLPSGQSGVVIAWESNNKKKEPSIQWISALAERPGHKCLEVGWNTGEKGTIDRFCFSMQDNSLPAYPAGLSGMEATGVSVKIFGSPSRAAERQQGNPEAEIFSSKRVSRTIFERFSRMSGLFKRVREEL